MKLLTLFNPRPRMTTEVEDLPAMLSEAETVKLLSQ